VSRNEVEDHIAVDHPRVVEDDSPPARGASAPPR